MPAWINPANLFTALRLLLVPFIIQAILAGRHTLALALFFLAAVTDVVDGALARRLEVATGAGAYFDPVADKFLLSGTYLALAAAGTVPWWFVLLIFGRDIYILVGVAAAMLWTPVRKFPPSVWGKVSTFAQIVTAVVWMARNVLRLPWVDSLADLLLWPAAAFTLWSGIHYTWRGVRLAQPFRN